MSHGFDMFESKISSIWDTVREDKLAELTEVCEILEICEL